MRSPTRSSGPSPEPPTDTRLRATADLGQPSGDRPFVGHVTLARCRDDRAGRQVCGTAVDLAFGVEEVAVVTSETRPEGARYTTVATAPLG